LLLDFALVGGKAVCGAGPFATLEGKL